ncbi:glycoside hydrolase family 95 protein [Rhodohalobacter sulfatireducens]|uniref:Glycoside hydrolase family 95 protein n=1 Tax=Rhodohalobacter sulfatireducens TaxID=2911366 RepID=A0ABS9KHX5_9BACT|nr:glycoside hydrolase family 95 protein [Rhodohalobacter sulfatireducens]MCG2590444.1 glycoside hydrolase family 95 protein [Rhodohalobacter sulfatireducens]
MDITYSHQKNRVRPLLTVLFIFSYLSLSISTSFGQDYETSIGDLQFDQLPERWDEGFPLGNGMVGALVWKQDEHLRFSLDRADLWDLREVRELRELTFDWVHQQVQKGEYGPVQQLGDAPYDNIAYPTKIQAAGLNFRTNNFGTIEDARLYLKTGELQIRWSEGAALHTFIHSEKPIGWFEFKNVPQDFKPILEVPPYGSDDSNESSGDIQLHTLADLGYDQGTVVETDNSLVYTQQGWDGMEYKVSVLWKREDGNLQGVWSITSDYPNQDVDEVLGNTGVEEDSEQLAEQALLRGFETDRQISLKWWEDFWARSQIVVPDTLLQRQYERDMYKFGAASRPGSPPISLQAVWTADNGSIPPWKGDFHHNLNTQLSYWPGYPGNHLELTQIFTDWLWNIRQENKDYTRWYFENEGLNVPGVTTLTGQPMGGWIQYSMSPTIAAWLAQHFYWQWSYSRDREFLENRAYPYLKDVAVHLEEVTYIEDGVRVLPLSSSPEIHDNTIDAWFQQTTNYDLALMKYAFKMAAELASELGKSDEQQRWEARMNELPDYSIDDETGLLVAPGERLNSSHRHFSHLMAIHPLGLMDSSHGDEEKKVIETSLEHLDEIGSGAWVGYSFSWQANLYARAGNSDKAREALQIFASNFVSPNSFHLNGDQKGGEYSNFMYRPFTLEGNFAFAAGLQEMLLQSHNGVIEIFPATPDDWADVHFRDLRAQGAFIVSAVKIDGQISEVHLLSEKGGTLQIENPYDSNSIKVMKKHAQYGTFSEVNDLHFSDGILSISMAENEEIKILENSSH